MATNYEKAFRTTSATARVNTGTTVWDAAAWTHIVLVYVDSAGAATGVLVGRNNAATAGWEYGFTSATAMQARWRSTSGSSGDEEVNDFTSVYARDGWYWIATRWDGTQFSVRSGPFLGTLANRTRTRSNTGVTLSSDTGITLRVGSAGSYHDGAVPKSIAFFGMWNSSLSDGDIDNYCADMTANGGLSSAAEYFKPVAADSASITGPVASTAGSYSSITLVDGPGSDAVGATVAKGTLAFFLNES